MLALVGEQGMLLFCVLLTVPFPLPSIPGVSTPFGLLILFIGIGITLNRVPWLPAFLMERRFAAEHLADLHKGRICWPASTASSACACSSDRQRDHQPLQRPAHHAGRPAADAAARRHSFTNAMPAWAILLLAIGMLQRDGLFVALGYAPGRRHPGLVQRPGPSAC